MKQEKKVCIVNLTNSNGEYIILICLWGVSPIRLRKLKAGIIKKISVMKSFLFILISFLLGLVLFWVAFHH